MARTSARQEPVQVEMDQDALATANNALTLQGKQAQSLMSAYNVTHYNPDGLEAEIRGFQQTAVEAMFAIGARLLVMRSVVDHGDWLKRLERMNMVPRAAQRVMQATMKFADPGKSREKLLGLERGKLIELLTLDDEQLDTLNAGGEVLELDFDDVARMSTSELRRELREAKQTVAAKDRLLEKRGKAIDQLQAELERPFKPTPGAVAQTEAEQSKYVALQEAHTEALAVMARLAVVVRDIKEDRPTLAMEQAADAAMSHLCQRTADICNENGLSVDLEALLTPDWMQTPDPAPDFARKKSKKS